MQIFEWFLQVAAGGVALGIVGAVVFFTVVLPIAAIVKLVQYHTKKTK